MRAKRAFICEICGICERILDFIALQRLCKSFNAKATKEYAKFAKLYFEALCFYEDAEISDPVFEALLQPFRILLHESLE